MMGYLMGAFAPGFKSFSKFKKSLVTLMKCHAIGYELIHKICPSAKVSYTKQVIEFHPIHKKSVIETLITYIGNKFMNYPTLDCILTGKVNLSFFGINLINEKIEGLKDSIDFIGINHYTAIFASRSISDWSGRKECPIILSNYTKKFKLSDNGWSLVPESLANTMEWINNRWNPRKLDIIISEHGISDKTDEKRKEFIMDSLAFLKEAIDIKNIPVKGYLYWSILDNYEWSDGYNEHFGLVSVNLDTQERKKRETCNLIAKIASKCK